MCTLSVVIVHIDLSGNVQQMYSIRHDEQEIPAVARDHEGEARVDRPRASRNARF